MPFKKQSGAGMTIAICVALSACTSLQTSPATVSPSSSPTAAIPTASPSPAVTPIKTASPTPTMTPSPSPSPIAVTNSPTPSIVPTTKATVAPVGNISTKGVSWYYMKQKTGVVPNFPAETKKLTPNQKMVWVGTGKKVYMTLDTGGPIGDTEKLLKAFRDNDVKVNFFLAGYNVKAYPDFVRQLAADGHLIANHTMTHKDMSTMTDAAIRKEITDYEALIKNVTGQEVTPYFRFPYGTYSPHLLDLVSEMGYTSVFWSTAMRDWEPRTNGADDSYNDIMNNLHDGNIILMHQGSEDNINAMDRIIKGIKSEGYEFALLTDFK